MFLTKKGVKCLILGWCLLFGSGCAHTTYMTEQVDKFGKRFDGGVLMFAELSDISRDKEYSLDMRQYGYRVGRAAGRIEKYTPVRMYERAKLPSVRVSLSEAFRGTDPIVGKRWEEDFSIGDGFLVQLKKCGRLRFYNGSCNGISDGYVVTATRSYREWYSYPAQPLKLATVPFDTAVSVTDTTVNVVGFILMLPVLGVVFVMSWYDLPPF